MPRQPFEISCGAVTSFPLAESSSTLDMHRCSAASPSMGVSTPGLPNWGFRALRLDRVGRATQAGPEAVAPSGRGRPVEADVLALRGPRRTTGPAVDPGRGDGGEEFARA